MFVVAVHINRIPGIADANVFVDDVLHQAALLGIGLDADAVIRPVDGEVANQNGARAAVGFAADRHTVPGVEVIVRDGHLRGGTGSARLDGDIIVAGVDGAVRDGDVPRIARVDGVG